MTPATLISKATIQAGDQDSFPPKAGYRAGFTIPVWEWPEPARHGASAPCLRAIVLEIDFWVQILGAGHRQPSIQIRCRWNYPVPVPQMNNVLLPRDRACNTVPPALSQRSCWTGRSFAPFRRWAGGLIGMVPAFGVRSSVVPEFPADPLRGQRAVPGPASRAGPANGER